ncbi:hypothetical protein [Candidatus Frankia alpina]|uniref:hypothetical protein n=1 Tax=Candidatus Frankia alpina TaxID=2699483 RepID=UPI0013D5DFC2|nr:hypothetical protein [Candidatus Frankia alpina]
MNLFLALLPFVASVWLVVTIRRRIGAGPVGIDLSDWHPRHRVPAGDVWAVTPPCGYGHWTLFAPGSRSGPWPYEGITPAATRPATEPGEYHVQLCLDDVAAWLGPWVEQVTGTRVVEMVEGLSAPYGPAGDLYEYVIYVRVVAP